MRKLFINLSATMNIVGWEEYSIMGFKENGGLSELASLSLGFRRIGKLWSRGEESSYELAT